MSKLDRLTTLRDSLLDCCKESVKNARLELEKEKNDKLVQNDEKKNSIKVELDNEIKNDLSKQVEENLKDQPVISKNV